MNTPKNLPPIRLPGCGQNRLSGGVRSAAMATIGVCLVASAAYELGPAGVVGGGGRANGGAYQLIGAVLPAFAGESAGGPYDLSTLSVFIVPGGSDEEVPLLKAVLAGGLIRISWATGQTNLHLQENPGLAPAGWIDVNTVPAVVDGENQVMLPLGSDSRFFRLERQ